MSGDLTLVAEVVERHDAIAMHRSKVLIETMTNQLEVSKVQVKKLENEVKSINKVKEELGKQVDKLNKFTCSYCNRRYSATLGLTRHLNGNCVDKMMNDMCLVIDLNKFKSYLELLDEHEIDEYNIELSDWETDDPILRISTETKRYKFKVRYNESRWRAVKLLEKVLCLPLVLLLDAGSSKFVNENSSKIKTLYKTLNVEDDYLLEDELKHKLGIVQDD
jgi:hypothetical protein